MKKERNILIACKNSVCSNHGLKWSNVYKGMQLQKSINT
jgi:hypothetical protein